MPTDRGQARTLLIVGALILTFVLGLWLPFSLKQARVQRALAALGDEIATDRRSVVSLTALGQQIVFLSQTAARFDKTVPPEPALVSLLGELTTTLEDHQVTALEVQPKKVIEGEAYWLIPIDLSFHGSFEAVTALLTHIEAMDRLMQINRVSVDGYPNRPGSPLEVTMELSAFCMPVKGVSGE